MLYCIFTAVFSGVMIYKIAPKYGKTNPLYYLSICASTGSVSVMSIKAFGIALKLTFAGNNQFTHPSTYAFAIVTIVCIMTQMNYFNKALSEFSQSMFVTQPLRILSLFYLPPRHTDLLQRLPRLLRHLHHRRPRRFLHPLQRLQYHKFRQYHLPSLRLSDYFCRRLPTQPLPFQQPKHTPPTLF